MNDDFAAALIDCVAADLDTCGPRRLERARDISC
jgi:hypothetical protein